VAVLCGSVFAYLASLPSPKGPRATITLMPFEFSLSLDKSTYSLKDNMTLSFYLRNVGNETVTIGKNNMDPGLGPITTASEGVTVQDASSRDLNIMFHFGYILFDSNGTVIDEHLEGQLQAGYLLVFKPDASLNQTLTINLATYDELYGSSGSSETIQKGSYQISGAIRVVPNVKNNVLETPSISFTIR
jgi:hypothetical protein